MKAQTILPDREKQEDRAKSHRPLLATLALPALCLLTSTVSSAQEVPLTLHMTAALGTSSQHSPALVGGSNLSGGARGTAFRLGADIQITPRFGAEIGYASLGKVSINAPAGTANYNTRIATVSGTASLPLNPSFSLVARAGLGFASIDLSVPSAGYSGSANTHPLVFGFGARYTLRPGLDLTLDFDYYRTLIRFQSGDSANASLLSLGLRSAF